MKINWKVRIRHRQFWVAIISAFVLLANHVASLFSMDITLISTKIQQLLETIFLILALFGIVIDPTTDGVQDSSQAMDYSRPRKETDKDEASVKKAGEAKQEMKTEVEQQEEANHEKLK
ncbi:phage holin [Ureibacillus aquaedulcis]|uniref:Phage holin n=1 Tax=Ureibacillus aquaedulcis TaxID=3058421 RepID=A0ABT8GQZ8_9BACL|nr:phage holin [Ureibacillus sp. BA0131]MDN4493376.1 phage holin [Ureibacillus sp. BA0131]